MSIPTLQSGWLRNLSPASVQNQPLMRRLPSDRALYPTAAYAKGDDIFVPLAVATIFGGPLDRGDNGKTASGILTSRPGGVVGCALPMPASRGCRGTPFAQFPWGTKVSVEYAGRTGVVEVVDEGPSGGLKSQAFIDITLEGWETILGVKLAPSEVNTYSRHVSFTVLGGMRFMADYHPYGVDEN